MYIPALYVVNKVDAITMEELRIIDKIPNYVPISAYKSWNIEELLEKIWQVCMVVCFVCDAHRVQYLNLTRVYTKPRGQLPDYSAPVIIRKTHSTVADFCNRIHKDMLRQMKHALVWGSSVKHQPQRVGKDHVLADEDIVQ